jgi:hypothetical protein
MSRARDTADQINRVNSSAADATAITVDSSENVGIGTDSSYPLTVQSGTAGNNHAIALRNSSNNFSRLGFLQTDSATAAYSSIDGDGRASGYLKFNTNDTERLRIDSDGLKFHGDTAAANALNDYEEGTWTPTHTGGSGTGSFSDARYTKIGNTVQVYFTFSFSGGGGSMAISGFPFNANGNTVGIGREDQTNGYGVYGRINSGDSSVYLYATQAASNASAYQVSNGAIKFAITYETNS